LKWIFWNTLERLGYGVPSHGERVSGAFSFFMSVYYWSGLVAAMFVVANIVTQKSLQPGQSWLQWLAAMLGFGGFLAFRKVCEQYSLARASAVVDGVMTLATVAIALAVFRDPINVKQGAGLALILVGLYMVR
jgi:drug/metabolite transporter (DMT)-like permease